MSGIPEATPVTWTMEERAKRSRSARSRRTEHRLRQRARIVLFAADGTASRAIGRAPSVLAECPSSLRNLTRLLLEQGGQHGVKNIRPTLQQSLTARLDRLGSQREVAQIGAVIDPAQGTSATALAPVDPYVSVVINLFRTLLYLGHIDHHEVTA